MSGLTNDDFRRIMATPRRLDPEQTPRHGSASLTAATGSSTALSQSRSGQRGSRPPSRPSRVESLLPAGYRDRAQERRDREQAAVIGSDPDQIHPKATEDNEDDDAAVAAESLPDHLTKYLGGDQDRTHLVRGLDYLLLERSRLEIQKQQEQRLEQAMIDAVAQRKNQDELVRSSTNATDTLTFRTPMARRIYTSCMDKIEAGTGGGRPRRTIGTFQPGRIVYQFETDTFGTATLPTVLHRSEDDCGSVRLLIETNLPDSTRHRLRDAMTSIREGRRPGPSHKHISDKESPLEPNGQAFRIPEAIAQQSSKTMDDDNDDDIFADAGDYICEPRAPGSKPIFPSDPIKFTPDLATEEDDKSAVAPAFGTVREAILQARSTAGQLGVYEKNLNLDNAKDSDNDEEQADQAASSQREQEPSSMSSSKLHSLYDDFDEYTAGIGYDSDEDDGRGNAKKLSAIKISKAKAKEKQKLNQQWQQISSMIDDKKKTTKRTVNGHQDDNSAGTSQAKRSRPN